jgi:hypothetical protein
MDASIDDLEAECGVRALRGIVLFGRVIYEMMEAAWRGPAPAGARPEWMQSFARSIDAAKKYVVSSTLERLPRQRGEQLNQDGDRHGVLSHDACHASKSARASAGRSAIVAGRMRSMVLNQQSFGSRLEPAQSIGTKPSFR